MAGPLLIGIMHPLTGLKGPLSLAGVSGFSREKGQGDC